LTTLSSLSLVTHTTGMTHLTVAVSRYTGSAFPVSIHEIYKYCEFSKVRSDAGHLEIQVDKTIMKSDATLGSEVWPIIDRTVSILMT